MILKVIVPSLHKPTLLDSGRKKMFVKMIILFNNVSYVNLADNVRFNLVKKMQSELVF